MVYDSLDSVLTVLLQYTLLRPKGKSDCIMTFHALLLQTDAMPINQWAYNAQLAQLCGPDVPRQPAWLQDLYAAITVHILGRPDSFRDEWGPKELAVYDLADKHCNQMLQSLV